MGGGLDDRFDFQLLSPTLFDGDGFSIMPSTYRSFGNDGDHYNVSINTGNNAYFPGQTARSNGLADALHDASDHIPVVADLMVPGLLTCVLDDNLGRVVSGGTSSICGTVVALLTLPAFLLHQMSLHLLTSRVLCRMFSLLLLSQLDDVNTINTWAEPHNANGVTPNTVIDSNDEPPCNNQQRMTIRAY